jgi:hypothetical protein
MSITSYAELLARARQYRAVALTLVDIVNGRSSSIFSALQRRLELNRALGQFRSLRKISLSHCRTAKVDHLGRTNDGNLDWLLGGISI